MNAQLQAWRSRWVALAPREKVMVGAAAAVVGLAIVWLLFIAPALSTLRSAESQRRTLDAQLQRPRVGVADRRVDAGQFEVRADHDRARVGGRGWLGAGRQVQRQYGSGRENRDAGKPHGQSLPGARWRSHLANPPSAGQAGWHVPARTGTLSPIAFIPLHIAT